MKISSNAGALKTVIKVVLEFMSESLEVFVRIFLELSPNYTNAKIVQA